MTKVMTLQDAINKLEWIFNKYVDEKVCLQRMSSPVYFDFCGYYPTTDVHSFRGEYTHLAIPFCRLGEDNPASPMRAEEFLNLLKGCLYKSFDGYKGGTYTMHAHTKLFVANYSESSNTGVWNIVYVNEKIVVKTKYVKKTWCYCI